MIFNTKVNRIIRNSLWTEPERWRLEQNERFLKYTPRPPHRHQTELVRTLHDDKWRLILDGLGYVRLSTDVQLRINWLRRGMRLGGCTGEESWGRE